MPPLRTALLSQLLGGLIAAAAIQVAYPRVFALPAMWAVIQGLCSALVSHKLGAPRWWVAIHLGFPSLAVAALRLEIPPLLWLSGFILLLLLYWRTDKSQVPLYLSNRRTARALLDMLPTEPCSFIDLGCGTGSLLHYLAKARPDAIFTGIEHAPLPFLLAWLRSLRTPNLTILYGNFWDENISGHQIVYTFLSPVPMADLWRKAHVEMLPHSVLISNSFSIPGIQPDGVTEVPDRRRTRLLSYLPAAGK